MRKYNVIAVRVGENTHRKVSLVAMVLSKITNKLFGLTTSRSEVVRDMIEFALKNGFVKNKIKDLKGGQKQ